MSRLFAFRERSRADSNPYKAEKRGMQARHTNI